MSPITPQTAPHTKPGNRWLSTSLTVLTLGIGLTSVTTAKADTPASETPPTPTVTTSETAETTASSLQKTIVPLPATTTPEADTAVQPINDATVQPDTPVTPPAAATPAPTTDSQTAIIPDQTNTPTDETQSIVSNMSVTATDANGTATAGNVVPNSRNHYTLNEDATDLHLNLSVQDHATAGVQQNVSYLFALPRYSSDTAPLRVATSATWADFTQNLPSSLALTYSVKASEYLTQDALLTKYPDFTFDQLLQVWARGTLAAGDGYTASIPLTFDAANQATTSKFWVYGMGDNGASSQLMHGLTLDAATTIPDPTKTVVPEVITGQTVYRAVLVDDPDNLDPSTYTAAPDWLQAQMPVITTDATQTFNSIANGLKTDTPSDTTYGATGVSRIRLATGLVPELTDYIIWAAYHGYNVVVNRDIRGVTPYITNSIAPSDIAAMLAATGGTDRQQTQADGHTLAISNMYYVRFIKEISATDQTVQVGTTVDLTDFIDYLKPHTDGETWPSTGPNAVLSPETSGGDLKISVYDPSGLLQPATTEDGNTVYQVLRTPIAGDTLPVISYKYGNRVGTVFSSLVGVQIGLTIVAAPVTPVDPDPDPGEGGGTTAPTDPGTTPETPGTGGTTTPPTDPGTTPETPGTGGTTTPPTDPGTTPETPGTGGPTTPVTEPAVTSTTPVTPSAGGQAVTSEPTTPPADDIVTVTNVDPSVPVSLTTHTAGQAAQRVATPATGRPSATDHRVPPRTPAAVPTTASRATTLPQTGEQRTLNPLVAGIIGLLALLGLVDRRHEK